MALSSRCGAPCGRRPRGPGLDMIGMIGPRPGPCKPAAARRVGGDVIEFTQEQTAVQTMVRDLARARIAPRAREWDERGEFPDELRQLLTEHQLLAMYVPEALGGLGFDLTTQCLVLEELAKVDGASAITLQDQGTSVHFLLNACGPEQRIALLT